MAGIGLILIAVSYSIIYWGVNAIQGKPQAPFISYIFPLAK